MTKKLHLERWQIRTLAHLVMTDALENVRINGGKPHDLVEVLMLALVGATAVCATEGNEKASMEASVSAYKAFVRRAVEDFEATNSQQDFADTVEKKSTVDYTGEA